MVIEAEKKAKALADVQHLQDDDKNQLRSKVAELEHNITLVKEQAEQERIETMEVVMKEQEEKMEILMQ